MSLTNLTAHRRQWRDLLTRAKEVFSASDGPLFDALIEYLSERIPRRPVRWMFTHDDGEGTHYTYHDETPENDYRAAYRSSVIKVTPLYEEIPDSWKDAVTDACTIGFVNTDETDARRTLARLIEHHVEVALDPRVSLAARALQEGTKPSAAGAIAPVMHVLANSGDASALPAPKQPPPVPEPATKWLHRNGNVYTVLLIANQASERPQYAPTIVYQGENGRTWSRPLSDWYRSFEPYGVSR